MTHVLVVYNDNYADEFDVEGFALYVKEEWKDVEKATKKMFKKWPRSSFQVGFGTNEYVEFDSLEAWKNSIEVKKITEVEFNLLTKLFGSTFGHICFADISERDPDEDPDEGHY